MGSGGSVETAPVPPVIRKMQKLPASRKVEKAENKRLPERRSDLVEAMPSMQKPQSSRKVDKAERTRLPEASSDPPVEATPKIQKPQASQEGRKADVGRLLRRPSPLVETQLQTPKGLEKKETEIKRLAERRSNPWETIPTQKPQGTRNVEAKSKRLPERWLVPVDETIAMQKLQRPQAVSQGEKADIKRLLEGGRGSSQQGERTERMQKPQASPERETYEIRPLRERWSEMVASPADTMPDMPMPGMPMPDMPMPDMPMPDMPMPPATFVRERAEIRQLRAERLREERDLNVKRSRKLSCSTVAQLS